MKYYNVKAVNPCNNRPCNFMSVPQSQLWQNEHGEMRFRYNDFYNDCEVISVEVEPQSKRDAMAAYFKQFGTACE